MSIVQSHQVLLLPGDKIRLMIINNADSVKSYFLLHCRLRNMWGCSNSLLCQTAAQIVAFFLPAIPKIER
jgi:hypothetical protein